MITIRALNMKKFFGNDVNAPEKSISEFKDAKALNEFIRNNKAKGYELLYRQPNEAADLYIKDLRALCDLALIYKKAAEIIIFSEQKIKILKGLKNSDFYENFVSAGKISSKKIFNEICSDKDKVNTNTYKISDKLIYSDGFDQCVALLIYKNKRCMLFHMSPYYNAYASSAESREEIREEINEFTEGQALFIKGPVPSFTGFKKKSDFFVNKFCIDANIEVKELSVDSCSKYVKNGFPSRLPPSWAIAFNPQTEELFLDCPTLDEVQIITGSFSGKSETKIINAENFKDFSSGSDSMNSEQKSFCGR